MPAVLIILAVLVVLIGLVVLKKRGILQPPGRERLPYLKRDYLLTKTEHEFFDALSQAVGGRWLVFAKVRVADLLLIAKGTPERMRHLNRITAKHVDFVLCSRDAVSPVLVIELNDKSHEEEDRQERDSFLDRAFADAGLPILAYPAKGRYAPDDILDQIGKTLSPKISGNTGPANEHREASQSVPEAQPSNVTATPTPPPSLMPSGSPSRCPKCGKEMVLRETRHGANAGRKFWGCTGYPACKHTRPSEA